MKKAMIVSCRRLFHNNIIREEDNNSNVPSSFS
jgi:hypothetical protein